jgi:3-phenylpropionate/cinnamic acid dioxygenase small subunit
MVDAAALKAKRMPAPPARSSDASLSRHVEEFYYRYAECICDDELERWPDFFAEECFYQIIPRRNHERGLPVAILLAESRGGLIDRVTAIRNTMVYAPRYVLQQVTNVRIVAEDAGVLTTRSLISVYQTLPEGDTLHLLVGRSFDTIDTSGPAWELLKRVVLYDTELLPATVIYPI